MILALDPLSKPVAISEILLLLALCAFIGWLIGRWLMNNRIQSMRRELSSLETELNDCRSTRSQHIVPAVATARTIQPAEKSDNLKVIEGIGPKIEQLLNANGINTFSKLADSNPEYINTLLKNAGTRFQIHDAGSWPLQAGLARDEKWDELAELQERLDGGKE